MSAPGGGRTSDVSTRDSRVDVVDPGKPRLAGAAPAAFLRDLLGGLPVAVVEAYDVQHAVEVVALVVHDAGTPPGALDAPSRYDGGGARAQNNRGAPHRSRLSRAHQAT